MLPSAHEEGSGDGSSSAEISELLTSSDRIAAEIAHLSEALEDRLGWSAEAGANHAAIVGEAARQASDALERAERETENFLAMARDLQARLRALADLEVAVRQILLSVEHLEAKVSEILPQEQ